MSGAVLLVVFIIIVALAFDYINGFHDAANSIATVVSTRVLTPMQAVAWAAFFNFVAAFGFGVQVAKTVGKGVVDAGVVADFIKLGPTAMDPPPGYAVLVEAYETSRFGAGGKLCEPAQIDPIA